MQESTLGLLVTHLQIIVTVIPKPRTVNRGYFATSGVTLPPYQENDLRLYCTVHKTITRILIYPHESMLYATYCTYKILLCTVTETE